MWHNDDFSPPYFFVLFLYTEQTSFNFFWGKTGGHNKWLWIHEVPNLVHEAANIAHFTVVRSWPCFTATL